MRRGKFRVGAWLWLGYPVAVGVFIAVSANLLFANQEKLARIWEGKDQMEQEKMIVADLRARLAALEAVDLAREKESLKQMLAAVPSSKMVWILVTELKLAASESGATLEAYRGSVGDVKEASGEAKIAELESQPMELNAVFSVKDFGQLKTLLANMETRLPLMKVNKLKYNDRRVEITVEGAWKASQRVARSDAPLPDYAPILAQVINDLEGFTRFGEVSVEGLGDTGVVDPF